MEEYLNKPLPLLPIDSDSISIDARSIRSIASSTGPFTTPTSIDDTQQIIQWQAAELLNALDIDVLIHRVPRLAGSFKEIERVPVIRSYMNMLLLLQEKDTQKQWITRIPYDQEDRRFLIDQVEPLIRASKRFNFRVPKIYHYGLAKDKENDLGVDYMLLDFMDGHQMPMWTKNFPSNNQKHQILDQMTDIYLEMFSKPVSYDDRLRLTSMFSDRI